MRLLVKPLLLDKFGIESNHESSEQKKLLLCFLQNCDPCLNAYSAKFKYLRFQSIVSFLIFSSYFLSVSEAGGLLTLWFQLLKKLLAVSFSWFAMQQQTSTYKLQKCRAPSFGFCFLQTTFWAFRKLGVSSFLCTLNLA